MRNIELKARLTHWRRAQEVCESLGARSQGDIHQIDTYFEVRQGRLKLREVDVGKDELVFYRRPDVPGPKGCDYLVEPAPRSLKPMLSESFGVKAVVDKVRSLYLWKNVRIHLDQVAELGEFIEFEAVLSEGDDDADGHEKLNYLIGRFGLQKEDHCAQSYLDMMLDKGASS